VLAIDMALKRDSVAVCEVRQLDLGPLYKDWEPTTAAEIAATLAGHDVEPHDIRYVVTAKIWYPANGRIPHSEVFDYIKNRAIELGPAFRGLVYDPRYFQLPAENLEDEQGLLVIQFDQSPQRMGPACGLAYDKIIAGEILHDGDIELASQVKAAVKRQWDRGFTLSKGKSRRHIDAAVAMCMGVWALAELAAEPEVNILDTIW
jgi:hypothetical protein